MEKTQTSKLCFVLGSLLRNGLVDSSLHFPQRIVFALGSAFMFHRDSFNLYSKFCAVHSQAEKLISNPSKKDEMMKSFLESRISTDPDMPSLGISSYLIKPMQVRKLCVTELKKPYDLFIPPPQKKKKERKRTTTTKKGNLKRCDFK